MKALVLVLFVLPCATSLLSYEKDRIYTPPTCCISFVPHSIPFSRVVSYYKTSGDCHKTGIVFLTTKGRQICANPSDAWVQKYIQILDSNPRSTLQESIKDVNRQGTTEDPRSTLSSPYESLPSTIIP